MPRFPDYWAKRAAGLCVECPASSPEFARCLKCRLRRQGQRSYWAQTKREGRSPLLIERKWRQKTPALAADEALRALTGRETSLLLDGYRRGYLHEDDEHPYVIRALSKHSLIQRERDAYGNRVPSTWVPSALGAWAAKRVIEGSTSNG